MRIRLNYQLAFAASLDAGNRHMQKAGRSKWNKADQLAATREFERLWPPCPHGVDQDECAFCPETKSATFKKAPRSRPDAQKNMALTFTNSEAES